MTQDYSAWLQKVLTFPPLFFHNTVYINKNTEYCIVKKKKYNIVNKNNGSQKNRPNYKS